MWSAYDAIGNVDGRMGKPELNHAANSREPCEGQLVVIHRLEVVLAEDLLELLLDVPGMKDPIASSLKLSSVIRFYPAPEYV